MKRQFLKSVFIVSAAVGLFSLSTAHGATLQSGAISKTAKNTIPAAGQKKLRNVYIIQFRENPVLGYSGGVAGLEATKPVAGKKAAMKSKAAIDYKQYLRSQQRQVLQANGIAERHTIYNYTNAFNGVAASLTEAEVDALSSSGEVVSIWKDRLDQLHTDSTHDFLNLTERRGGAWRRGIVGEDVVVGIIDSGIYPEHPSFADVRTRKNGNRGAKVPYGPPPASWTGTVCDFGNTAFNPDDVAFSCNNKLLGARHYADGFLSGGDPAVIFDPGTSLSGRDDDGHGSAAASNAAGNYGVRARIAGERVGDGPISGVAPRARIASYKVCWDGPLPGTVDDGCANSDSMAAIDQAVEDGVDVINFSIGGASTSFGSPDSVAFLFAADAGVFVATSAGNSGPLRATVGAPGIVPWITAVGAVNDDQNFALGISITAPASVAGEKVAIEGAGSVLLADAGPISGDVVLAQPADGCTPLTNAADVDGKIALIIRGACAFDTKYAEAEAAGATALVVYNDGAAPDRFNPFSMGGIDPSRAIPGVMIGFNDGDALANETGVTATLDDSVQIPQENTVAEFSSRGENNGSLDIIKPDVAAPGVNILGAETPFESVDSGPGGEEFQYISGTSFSSPHVAGAFALLKEAHPDWTPAMARSALMTSARQNLENQFTGEAATPFDIGAGHIEVNDALDPGLVYDVDLLDYAAFSCGNNVQLFSDGACDFLEIAGFSFDGSDLNLPSIGVGELIGTQTVTRTVTNVSDRRGRHVYRVRVEEPEGIDVQVTPSVLRLRSGESASYSVTFTVTDDAVANEFVFGSLTWEQRGRHRYSNRRGVRHSVRSPIAVRPVAFSAPDEVDVAGSPGTAAFDVQFGYEGAYTAQLNGIAPGFDFPGTVDSIEGLDLFCFDLPAHDHFRFATFDQDTTTPGADDIDLRLFLVDNCTDFNILAQLGSSGGATSEEVIDVVNPQAGGYVPVIDYFAAANGDTPIDYIAWVYLVLGDEGNATITAPAAAVNGTSGAVEVEYDLGEFAPGVPVQRGLGVVSHQDDSGEIDRTIIDVDNTQ